MAANTETSTSVYGDGRISTHAEPTRSPCACPSHGCSACIPSAHMAYALLAAMARAICRPILGF